MMCGQQKEEVEEFQPPKAPEFSADIPVMAQQDLDIIKLTARVWWCLFFCCLFLSILVCGAQKDKKLTREL